MKIQLSFLGFVFMICVLTQSNTFARYSTDDTKKTEEYTDSMKLELSKFVDPDSCYIDTLLLIQQQTVDKRNGVNGFRIQISSGNKSLIDSDNKKFLSIFPEIQTIKKFKTPDFILQAGNFRTRSEALKALSQVEKVFPSAFVLKETIDFPDLEP